MAGRGERAAAEGRGAIFEKSSFGRGRTRVVLALAVLMLMGALITPGSAFAVKGKKLKVTNTNDAGEGSLRQAMNDANASTGKDTIRFKIKGDEKTVREIAVTTPLPDITDPVNINGYSQKGSKKNTQKNGSNARPLIEVTGGGTTVGNGFNLVVGSDGSTIRGLIVNGFQGADEVGNGIRIDNSNGNSILGNFIGTTADGTAAQSNQASGIFIRSGQDNVVGDNPLGARNLISGNGNGVNTRNPGPSLTAGVLIRADASSVNNNVIGPSAAGEAITTDSGTPTLVQNVGVQIEQGASDNVVGATKKSDKGNVISGNATRGVLIQDVSSAGQLGTSGNSVSLNRVGTNLAGGRALPGPTNREAVQETGIQFRFGARDNFVGVGPDNSDSPGFGNTIAFNEDDGILVGGTQEMAEDQTDANLIRFNSIRNNGGEDNIGLGINADAGVSDTASAFEQQPDTDPNSGTPPYDRNVTNLYDSLDPDTGPNNENNMPVLEPTVLEGSRARVKGNFNSIEGQGQGGGSTPTGTEPNTTFVIDFYVNSTIQPQNEDDPRKPRACDPSDFGEGETYVGSTTVTTDQFGKAPFNVLLPKSSAIKPGTFIVATDTKLSGPDEITQPPLSSSEFSKCSRVSNS